MKPIFRAQNALLPAIPAAFSFEIGSKAKTAIYGPLKWNLLEIIAGKVPDPKKKISYPSFGHDIWPSQAIEHTKFGQSTSTNAQAPFIGARYESFRDEFDVSLRSALLSKAPQDTKPQDIEKVAEILDLTSLLDNWNVGLSNGQSRRAQLAMALLRKPRLLVMDEPFLGLDPANRAKFGDILNNLPIPVVIGLRGGEIAPQWITQFLYASENGVAEGQKALDLIKKSDAYTEMVMDRRSKGYEKHKAVKDEHSSKVPTIEMKDVTIQFPNSKTPLFKNLNLTVYDGERVHVRGPNGSGKSTLLALITADHPHVWSKDISLFGERLRVGKHSYFSINQKIGHSSPEIHAIFPKYLNARRAICTGFSGSMIPPAELSSEQENSLRRTAKQLNINISDTATTFGQMPLDQQKLVLLARALVKSPRVLILDEAFSTLNSEQMELALRMLDDYDGAVLVVGHMEHEIPICDKQLNL